MFQERTRLRILGLMGVAALSLFAQRAGAYETITTTDSKGVSVTIYNDNFGIVKDTREVELKDGLNYVSFEDVASQIEPTSVKFRSLTAPNEVIVREQNYRYDLLEPSTILYKSIGKTATFRQTLAGGQVNQFSGKILFAPQPSAGGGLVIESGDKVILNPEGQVELTELPPNMFSKPSLLWTIAAEKAGKHRCEVSYQTGGMNWHADYVAVVNDGDSKADLNSWVTLDNQSGGSFKQAGVKLMAGEVHNVPVTPRPRAFAAKSDMMLSAQMVAEPQFEEKAFAEYHLYTLNGKTDINNKETKQLSLFQAAGIPVNKRYIFDWGTNNFYNNQGSTTQNAQVKIEIENKQENHLGMPLPAGDIRVMKMDKDGSMEFVGADHIKHTPKDEKIRILIGKAFDIVGERKQMSDERSGHNRKTSYQIELRNHKEGDITCTVVEHAYGDWKINSSSMPSVKKDSSSFEFTVPIKANSNQTITYEIETRF